LTFVSKAPPTRGWAAARQWRASSRWRCVNNASLNGRCSLSPRERSKTQITNPRAQRAAVQPQRRPAASKDAHRPVALGAAGDAAGASRAGGPAATPCVLLARAGVPRSQHRARRAHLRAGSSMPRHIPPPTVLRWKAKAAEASRIWLECTQGYVCTCGGERGFDSASIGVSCSIASSA